ncbi:gfo/Idh/MocA family oxidoreductase [Geodermatophilus sp. TF02-6]|uniref:Gfo/Idh/MocA family protein n=1 Tax=Geodermatophilus sp. TF02-6 TaxID=2250575 RepID=UPI000DEB538B|nr:Gfo/Idh/MocA family oxidoreductase [Geodermatophilus sp. TF02-6]RBY83616.1 gfo/Idh/MocA family oxidoreductase [Geodermatophilus sp. TF02-6]
MTSGPLRIGVLGAARISERGIVVPARTTGARLVAVAARDPARAEEFARAHGVERVLPSYADVLADPEVEAVYDPLPNALHGPWNLAAVAAGKHVLSEKPFAANAAEAAEVRDAAERAGLVVMEGFHHLYHPVVRRLLELVDSGELGDVVHVQATIAMLPPDDDDPRWSLELAGGALMDLGCYGLHAARHLAPWTGGEPEPVAARAGERAGAPGVDEWLDVDLRFPSGATATVRCSMVHPDRDFSLRIVGTRGEATAPAFVEPNRDDRVLVRTPAGARTEHLGTRSSYTYQLEAFTAAVRHRPPAGAPAASRVPPRACEGWEGSGPSPNGGGTGGPSTVPTDADDAVATMTLVDRCYELAGLAPRPRLTVPTASPRLP